MYNKHILIIITITTIAYISYYMLDIQYIITNVFTIVTSFVLLSLTGFNLIMLVVILSTDGLLKRFDNRKKNKTELEIIISYYNISFTANLITSMIILASLNKAVTPFLFSLLLLSITMFYLCFKIFLSLFLRKNNNKE